MALVVYNPTNEDMEAQYVGETVIIEGETAKHYDGEDKPRAARCKIRMDDARARHILNILGPRGLVTLEYGDEGDGESRKAQEGISRNKDFKYKQVIDFNTLNEQRYQSRLPYINPPKHLREYSNELGIELRQPYAVEDVAKKEMAEALQNSQEMERQLQHKDKEIEDLKAQMGSLADQVKNLVTALGAKQEEAKTVKSIAGKWAKMNRVQLHPWIIKNWEQIQMLQDDDFKDLQDRYLKIYKTKMPTELAAFEEEPVAA